MLNDPANSYGFILHLITAVPYASLIFATSDYPNADKHPKLVIEYETLDINSIDSEEFSVYPIPAKNIVHIVKESNSLINNVRLVNSQGMSIEVIYEDGLIDISRLEKGIYFLTIISNNKSFTKKIIKI